jgi:hypothetical protein
MGSTCAGALLSFAIVARYSVMSCRARLTPYSETATTHGSGTCEADQTTSGPFAAGAGAGGSFRRRSHVAWSDRITNPGPVPCPGGQQRALRRDSSRGSLSLRSRTEGLHALRPPPCWGCSDIVPMAPTSGGGVPSSSAPSQ